MTLSGAEHTANPSGKRHLRVEGGAESGALAQLALDPDLSRIVAAWPNLPEPIKAAMRALLGSAL